MLAPTTAQIRAQVSAVWTKDKARAAPVIGIRAPLSTEAANVLRVGEQDFPVARSDSVLEIREILAGLAAGGPPLVLLTPLAEAELGADVVARLAKRRVFGIEPWQLVKDRFRARYVDPRLVQQHAWVAPALLEAEPEGGYPPAPSGFLEAELAWRVLFEAWLGLPGGQRDAESLLEWSLGEAGRAAAARLAPEARAKLVLAVEQTAGTLARRVFECAIGPHGALAPAAGLVARTLFGPKAAADTAASKAAGKLEALLGVGELSAEHGSAWADAAEALVERRLAKASAKEVQALVAPADALIAQIGAGACAHRSRFLDSGRDRRLEAFAEALGKFVKGSARTVSRALEDAAEAVLDHVVASLDPPRTERVEMARRLARWLAGRRAAGSAAPGSLAEAAAAYRADGSYVDWARARLWDGDPIAALGDAYTRLWRAVAEERERENRRFGELLAGWTRTGSHAPGAIPVEAVLERVVAPLAGAQPVLLVVVDGMSLAVFRELQEDLARRAWVEAQAEAAPVRVPVIAALPTVTEVSRASLLSGCLGRGLAPQEKEAFARHPALLAASQPARPPLLFHKGDLTASGSVGVAPGVLSAVADLARRVVGVVINAVDDHLAKGDQTRFAWTLHSIKPLDELMVAARDAGRAVVLVSDHGHVPEHDTLGRPADTAERWREAGGPPGDDEVLLQGPRVVLGTGQRVIAPWSERVHFGMKKNGYHGGASPQEVVIPLGVFLPPGVEAAGWAEVAPEHPAWWEGEGEGEGQGAEVPAPRKAPRRKPAAPSPAQESLFPAPEAAVPEAPAGPAWIDALLASPTLAEQRRAAARVALPEDRIRAILAALDERGGKLTRPALAKRLGVPAMRLGGILSALRRILNVEGYPVLAIDEASDTVELNREQLFVQFGINAATDLDADEASSET